MNKTPSLQRSLFLFGATLGALGALGLTACGGGGGDDATYFAVQGTRSANGLVATVCLQDAAYTDPASPSGQNLARNLAGYYGIVGSWRSYAGTGRGCREQFPVVDVLLTVEEYNRVVLPAAQAGGAPAPAPAPPPAAVPPEPPPIACTEGSGPGTAGLTLSGTSRIGALTTAAQQSTTLGLDPGEVAYRNPALAADAITGSLRARLWAVPGSYGGGAINGYVVSTYDIRFTDGSNQLRNGESSDLSERTLPAQTPPTGAYCMVVTLEEYDPRDCSTADRYCIADWAQFGSSRSFR